VGKGVRAHDRLFGCTVMPVILVTSLLERMISSETTRVSARKKSPRTERHDDLFQGTVPCPFADAVHRAFHLPLPRSDRGQNVGNGKPRSLWQWTEMTALSMFFTLSLIP